MDNAKSSPGSDAFALRWMLRIPHAKRRSSAFVFSWAGDMPLDGGIRAGVAPLSIDLMTIEDSLPEGTSRAAQVLRTVTSIIRHHSALMRQARALYRVSRYPLHREPRTMYWIDRYLRFYDSKPLYRLDANHAAAFLSFVTTKDTCTEAEEALRFFHDRVLHRPLPEDLMYHMREARSPEHRKASATRSLWPRPAR